MDITDAICRRRSIRKYKNGMLPEAYIDKVLEAARWAPSGLNNQPWRFLVIKDKAKKEDLSKFTKYANIIREAPIAIVVCMDLQQG